MRYYAFMNHRVSRAVLIAFFAAMLLLVRDSLFSSQIVGFTLSQFALFGITGLLGLVFLVCNRKSLISILRDGRIVIALISAAVLIIPMLLKRDWQLMYLTVLFALLIGILLSFFSTIRQASRCYVVVLSCFAVVSVLCAYLLRIPVDMGLLPIPVLTNSAGVEFYWFGISFVPVDFVTFRNFGIFREPGVYQFFLLLALYLNNYEAKWEKASHLWILNGILAVTMVSTFATGGVVEMGLLAIVVFFDKGYYKDRRFRVLAYILIAAVALVVAYCFVTRNDIYWALYDMFSKLFTKHESTMDRLGSITLNVRMFLRNPLLGGTIYETLHAIDHNTSSSTIIFAMFGLLCGLWHILGWLLLTWEKGRKLWLTCVLAVIMAMSFNTCNVVPDAFLWVFPMMAICEKGLPLISGLRKKKENQE